MVSLSESDLIWASATGLAGFFFLACCVGFCCWRDAQRRSRWDQQKDADGGEELSAMEGGLPVSRLAQAAAAKAAAAVPPIVAPLLVKGYLAPSKRLDARKWRQRGNNVQSKFAKVTAVFEDFSADDQLFRAYGALSVAQEEDSESRSARSIKSTPSLDSNAPLQSADKDALTSGKVGSSKAAKKDAGLGKKAPRRGEKGKPERKATSGVAIAKSSQGTDSALGRRTLSAEAQAALEGKPAEKKSGALRQATDMTDKSLPKVQPPLPLDIEALKPSMVGKGASWPVTEPPPAPISPVPKPPPARPPVTPQSIDRAGTTTPGVMRAPPAPIKEVPSPRPPRAIPPVQLASNLPNGGDLLSQIEFPSNVLKTKVSPAPHSPPRRKKPTPVAREDESSNSSGFEESPPRHRTPRQPRTPQAGGRDSKFDALDAELAEEVEADVTRAVSLAFDSKALQRTSSGLPCSLRESGDSGKRSKRSSSPKDREKKHKRKKSIDNIG